ncbi:beta strand repeat-containing protein, partial [Roseimaritima sediminicola]|uniref:beta strand repeat-containing protein n=1 Tax=Roseimaritima sediminicola TaxID=2662066 RepID=UPI001298496A
MTVRKRSVRPTRRALRRKLHTTLAGEQLEDRRLLAVVLPELTVSTVESQLVNAGFSALLSSIPSSSLNATPPQDISVMYHAFPQEANDVKVSGDLLNLFLYINEQNDDIFVQRNLPAFNDDLLEDFKFTVEFIAGVEIPAAHLLGLDFPDVEAIVPNPDALSQFLPSEVQQLFEAADQVLNTTIFPELEVFDTTIIPSLNVGDLIGGVIPGPVDDLLIKVVDILGGGSRGGIQLHLLDGNDTADLSELSGVVQEVYGGIGNDVLMGGGSTDPIEVLGVTQIAPPVNPRIALFGGEGRDKLVVNNRFDVVDYRVHGGSGNDLLVVPGSDFNDIIRIVSDASGNLQRIEYLAPSSTGGAAQNEIQTVALPAGATGTFTLTFDGQTTGPIAHNATPGDVETALAALTSISGVTVGGVAGAWTVEFDGAGLAAMDQPNMAANGTNLLVTGGTIVVDPTVVGGSVLDNEIQRVALPAGTTGGQFALQLGAQTTALLPYNADPSAVRAALAALPAVGGTNNVSVTSPNALGGPWDIEFTGALSGTNQPTLTTANSSLVGFAAGSSVATTTNGVLQVNEKQSVSFDGTTGTFTHTFGGFTTPPIPVDASPLAIQNILTDLPSIGAGNLLVTGAAKNYVLEYTGALGGTDQPLIGIDTSGSNTTLTVRTNNNPPAVAGVDEVQTISVTPAANGGSFNLTFNGETTSPIAYNAAPSSVRSALGALPSIGGTQNIDVSGVAGGPYTVTFVNDLGLDNQPLISIDDDLIATAQNLSVTTTQPGGTPTNDVQTITLPANAVGGTFSLAVGGVPIPANLPANATAAQVELVLEASPALNNVTVTGGSGGPFTVEVLSPNPGTPAPIISGNGANLTLMGTNLNIVETQFGASAGDQLLVTTTITELSSIEQLQIDLEGGDDRVIFQGVPKFFNNNPIFQQGIFVDGGGGTDVIEMQSLDATPNFQAPIFPDDVAATLQFDGQAIQFADVEGGLEFDAQGKAGTVLVSGTDASNDIRFRSLGGGEATFANDGQVTITLQNFLAPSTVNINGEQGEDTVSLFLGGNTQFSQFNVDGDGPDGADSLRIEGTANADAFVLTQDAANPKNGVIGIDGLVTVNYTLMDDLSFIGDGGVDSLTVNEPSAGGNDTVLFSPQVGNGGGFQWVTQGATPDTAVVYAPVEYQSLEMRTFNTGTGVDVFAASTDDLPGVNSSATVVGGTGSSTITFGDQQTTFLHDTTDADTISMEIGTDVDDVNVTPGAGVTIAVNTAFGSDTLSYQVGGGNVTWDIPAQTIRQPGLGDVLYTSLENLVLVNPLAAASDLNVLGGVSDERLMYLPLTPTGGRVEHSDATVPVMTFDNFGGTFTVDAGGGSADVLSTVATAADDQMIVDMAARTVSVVDSLGTARKPVTLAASTEIAVADASSGDDQVLVVADSGATLQVQVEGGGPLASDRLVVEDVGPGDLILHRESHDLRAGSVQVGMLPPIVYEQIERVDILPLNPITGGTGADGAGRVVVFHADPFEQNDSLVNPTEVPDLFQSTVKANIGFAAAVNPFATGLNLPGDEDWYRFRAPKIGTFSFEVLFDRIAGLPGGGELNAAVYRADGTLIAASTDVADGDVVSFSADTLTDYHLRVTGATDNAINIYEINLVEVDLVGPQVYDPDGAGPLQAIQIPTHPQYNLFGLKGSDGQTQGPTPVVNSLVLNLRDILNREDRLPADLLGRAVPNGRAPGDLYPALDELVAQRLGHFEVRGDHSGLVAIESVRVVNATPVEGQIATATVELVFAEPLPDDRYTLTIRDTLVDPAGNAFDGESNAAEPNGAPTFPTGDDQ